jgi:hypothetical protein
VRLSTSTPASSSASMRVVSPLTAALFSSFARCACAPGPQQSCDAVRSLRKRRVAAEATDDAHAAEREPCSTRAGGSPASTRRVGGPRLREPDVHPRERARGERAEHIPLAGLARVLLRAAPHAAVSACREGPRDLSYSGAASGCSVHGCRRQRLELAQRGRLLGSWALSLPAGHGGSEAARDLLENQVQGRSHADR